jgi:adenosylcobyric acid synthase
VTGYEIHCGISSGSALERPAIKIGDKQDGALSMDDQILGTYVHGLFDHQEAREALLNWAGLSDDFTFDYQAKREQEINRLADAIEQALDIDRILQSVSLA